MCIVVWTFACVGIGNGDLRGAYVVLNCVEAVGGCSFGPSLLSGVMGIQVGGRGNDSKDAG